MQKILKPHQTIKLIPWGCFCLIHKGDHEAGEGVPWEKQEKGEGQDKVKKAHNGI